MNGKPDIIAKIHFYKTEENGRKGPITVNIFRCPAEINGDKFDCAVIIGENKSITPGDTVTIPVAFLSSKIVRPMLKVGSRFTLWSLGTIADCVVEEIIPGD